MKTITITVSVDGNELTRKYNHLAIDSEGVINDMLGIIEKSHENKF